MHLALLSSICTFDFVSNDIDFLLISIDFPATSLTAGTLRANQSKVLVPGLVFLIGAIALIELINHARHHGEEQFMTLFWIEFDTTSFLPYLLFTVMVIVGFYVSRIIAREIAEAWGEATFVEGERR